jgi:hypothetical protein
LTIHENFKHQDWAENIKNDLGERSGIDIQPFCQGKANAGCQQNGEKIIKEQSE